MKLRLRFVVVLLALGILPEASLFAASSENAEAAGRHWAEQWLSKARIKHNPAQPVNLTPSKGHPDFEIQAGKSRYQKPLITGPVALLLNLSAAIPKPQDSEEFPYWIKYTANDAMKSRYQKIMQDLIGYYQSRGYPLASARLEANNLFHTKSSIYYPLVYGGSPDLQGLNPNETRNPYGSSPLANSAADNYNLGLICQKVENYVQAAQLYEQAASTGHASAQTSLAYLYEIGKGVPRNADKALAFYTRAARQGHAVAQYNLGRIYQNGLSDGKNQITPNSKQAEYYLQRAAAQGIINAHHQLGMLYYNFGLQIDAKSLNSKDLQSWDTNKDDVISPHENQYLRDAHDHFLLAAQGNHGPALHALGVMYLQGHGVQSDPGKAVHWLKKAVAFPQPDSYYNLAQLYETGQGTEVNLSRAFVLYQQAARMSHAPSQYNIGLFYYQGRRAGSLISVNVTEEFALQHSGRQIINDMVSRNPQQNAVLTQATALYRPSNPNSPFRTLNIFVNKEHTQFAVQVLLEILPSDAINTKPTITHLGGDDPIQASAWWTLAAEQKQPAAQQALSLVNRLLTPEQNHVAKAIAATERARMNRPSPQVPTTKGFARRAFHTTDWGTGFFVSNDGYVIAGKHLLLSGNRFQITTENGTFPAKVVPVTGDLNQYLLLKIQGNYDFPALSLASSHSTRLNDTVQTIGYQMPDPNSNGQPRPTQADTRIGGVLGAQADPRFFSLTEPVLGDQIIFQFERYLDDDLTPNQEVLATNGSKPKLRELQSVTLERLRGALRAKHPLLRSLDINIGYELSTDLWYDSINHKWLTKPDSQDRAQKHAAGSWVTLDNDSTQRPPHVFKLKTKLWYDTINHKWLEEPDSRNGIQKKETVFAADSWVALDNDSIQQAPPIKNILEHHQALLRVSVLPAIVSDKKQFKRLYQIIEDSLSKPASGSSPATQLERLILDAKFSVVERINGFRGAALMNGQGQAIGLFFPGNQTRSPDVFQNFSSYHRYMLKSDQLLAFLNRASNVKYETQKPEIPTLVSTNPASLNSDAYLLAKAQASMVLVQVSSASVASASKGGTK